MSASAAFRFVNIRPVDLFADLAGIDEKNKDRIERSYKGARVIYSAVRVGRAAASRGNVVLAWIGAGEALLDAIGSYAAYRQVVEITRQLEAEGEALRIQMAQARKQWDLTRDVANAEQRSRMAAAESKFAVQREEFRIQREHYDDCKEQLKRVGAALAQLRQASAPSCPRLTSLERAYYRIVHEQIQAAIILID